MAWPKRGTRQLVVDGASFLWHYDGCCLWCSNDVITVGREGVPYVLFIDPVAWHFEFRPAQVVDAIRWALKEGWTPENGPTRAMGLNDETEAYEWLADGQRHLRCKPPTPFDA